MILARAVEFEMSSSQSNHFLISPSISSTSFNHSASFAHQQKPPEQLLVEVSEKNKRLKGQFFSIHNETLTIEEEVNYLVGLSMMSVAGSLFDDSEIEDDLYVFLYGANY